MNVSICIPTYNQAPFLEMAVRSAAQQTYKPFEIIVFDDCSTDETQEVLQTLSREISILIMVRQPQNVGIAINVDSCLRFAKGEIIIRLDSDDCLSPEYTERLMQQLLKFPTAGYAHAAVQEIDNNGHFLRERSLFRKSGFQTGDEALSAAIKGYRVAANILMFRREALIKVDYISSRINFAEDYHMAVKIAAAGFGNVYLNEILSYYRVWIDKQNVRQRRKLAEIQGFRSVFEQVLEPAYKNKGWNLRKLEKKRADVACVQASCLSWKLYTKEEKLELEKELSKLSNTPKTKLYAWIYLHNSGKILTIFSGAKLLVKTALKKLIVKKA